MARTGDAVVETDHGIVFVPHGVVGDVVRLSRVDRRGKVVRSQIAEFLTQSDLRQHPPCPDVMRCGGCSWMTIRNEEQHQIHRRWLESLVHTLSDQEIDVDIESDVAFEYRNRARLFWNSGKMGYRKRRTKKVVNIQECIVLRTSLRNAWKKICSELSSFLSGNGEIMLAQGTEFPTALFRTDDEQTPELYSRFERFIHNNDFSGLALQIGDTTARWGCPEESYEGADGFPLLGPLGGFSQAHATLNHRLVQYVYQKAQPSSKRVLELFSGNGNFSILLARDTASFVAVEQHSPAAMACRKNLRSRGLSGRIVERDSVDFPRGKYDVVVLDPPRIGAKTLMPILIDEKIPQIIYISCNIATLERDAQILARAGYRTISARVFAMFPQTHHAEYVLCFSR